jgi:hypothetical protein
MQDQRVLCDQFLTLEINSFEVATMFENWGNTLRSQ